MIKLDNVTLVAVSTVKYQETLYALRASMKDINFYEVLFLTDKSNIHWDGIKEVKIPKLDYDAYGDFIIYELHKFIKTSHCLIIQYDGFIINSKLWKSSFLKYDYIGAPFQKRKSDPNYARDANGTFYSVGNGGFSLRSKRLLEAPSKYNLKRTEWSVNSNEDGFFCVEHRAFLENKGYKWPDSDIAKQFSIESGLLSFHFYFHKSFGFHGKRMLQKVLFLKKLRFYGN